MTTYSSTPTRRRRPTWPAMLVAGAVVLVGAGIAIGALIQSERDSGDVNITADQARDIQASIKALPKCADVFQVGQKIDQAKAAGGCLDPDGGAVLPGSFRCNDGRHLWQVDANTGAPAGWGFNDDTFHAGKAETDPGYSEAYDACMS